MARVTVLMSVKDEPVLVRQAIDSILAQSMAEWKMLILDDACTDQTPAVLASYGDPRIEVIRNPENLGLTASLNRGLEMVDTELVARQDADDRSHPERLARQLSWFEENPKGVLCGTNMRSIDGDGVEVKTWVFPETNKDLQKRMPETNCICHGSAMFRAALGKELRYRSYFRFAQDYDLWLRMMERGEIGVVQELLYDHRMHSGTVSSSKNYEQSLFAGLARELHAQRKGGARDALEQDPDALKRDFDARLADNEARLEYYVEALDSAHRYIAELEQYRDYLRGRLDKQESPVMGGLRNLARVARRVVRRRRGDSRSLG